MKMTKRKDDGFGRATIGEIRAYNMLNVRQKQQVEILIKDEDYIFGDAVLLVVRRSETSLN